MTHSLATVCRGKAPLLLCCLLLAQVLISLPRLDRPFLEGREHWVIDDAANLLRAIHSQDRTLPTRLGIFGLKEYVYDAEGAVVGFKHYHHHPVLTALLFKTFTLAAGFHHWVPRTFALILSLLTTAAVFLLLRSVTEDDGLAFAFALLHVLLPLHFNYQDAWKHEVTAGLFVWLCFLFLHHADEGRGYRRAFLVSFFLLFQSGWVAYPVAGGMLLYVFLLRRSRGLGSFPGQALAAAIAGIAVNFTILAVLGARPQNLGSHALVRMSGQMQGLSLRDWAATQAGFLSANFTHLNVILAILLLAACGLRFGARSHPLTVFGGMTMAGVAAYLAVFRNQCHSHHYIQWLTGAAIVLTLAGAYGTLKEAGTIRPGRLRAGAFALLLVLLSWSLRASYRMETDIQESDFASAEDIDAIVRQQRRLVVSWDGKSGPKGWWISSPIQLYTDPFYKAWRLGRRPEPASGGIAHMDPAARPVAIRRGSDVVVAMNSPDSVNGMRALLARSFGVRCLRLDSVTPMLAFLVPAADSDCAGSRAGRMLPARSRAP
ncbi:MAG: hypothetical protein HY924_07450 [Elusimicrobia bacterium]|nr:hypothetical protein [Elusimicrobiota bacterium]